MEIIIDKKTGNEKRRYKLPNCLIAVDEDKNLHLLQVLNENKCQHEVLDGLDDHIGSLCEMSKDVGVYTATAQPCSDVSYEGDYDYWIELSELIQYTPKGE